MSNKTLTDDIAIRDAIRSFINGNKSLEETINKTLGDIDKKITTGKNIIRVMNNVVDHSTYYSYLNNFLRLFQNSIMTRIKVPHFSNYMHIKTLQELEEIHSTVEYIRKTITDRANMLMFPTHLIRMYFDMVMRILIKNYNDTYEKYDDDNVLLDTVYVQNFIILMVSFMEHPFYKDLDNKLP